MFLSAMSFSQLNRDQTGFPLSTFEFPQLNSCKLYLHYKKSSSLMFSFRFFCHWIKLFKIRKKYSNWNFCFQWKTKLHWPICLIKQRKNNIDCILTKLLNIYCSVPTAMKTRKNRFFNAMTMTIFLISFFFRTF